MIPREMAERVLRRAIEDHARDADALSEQDIVEVAREVGVDPEHVWRALEHERRLEWVKESVRSQHEVDQAALQAGREIVSPPDWRELGFAALLGGSFGAFAVATIGPSLDQVRTPADYAALLLIAVITGLCFLPVFRLLAEIVKALRRRGR